MMVMAYYRSVRADIFRMRADSKLKRFYNDLIALVISADLQLARNVDSSTKPIFVFVWVQINFLTTKMHPTHIEIYRTILQILSNASVGLI